jgi:hypothetical protein
MTLRIYNKQGIVLMIENMSPPEMAIKKLCDHVRDFLRFREIGVVPECMGEPIPDMQLRVNAVSHQSIMRINGGPKPWSAANAALHGRSI